MATRLGREIIDQEDDDQAADHRHQNDPGSPGADRCELVGVKLEGELAEEGDVMDQRDQGAKGDRANAGDRADDQGQNGKSE